MKELKILCPTGHLSYTRMEIGSFKIGLKNRPDAICADAGSDDIGPYPLGADVCTSPEVWQKYDLENMLIAARELKIPMIVGSANDCGTNKGVDKFAGIIKEIARKHKLKSFKLGTVKCDLDKSHIQKLLNNNKVVKGLDGRSNLTQNGLDETDNMVAVMGVEPIQKAIEEKADVVITSRTSDCCVFASVALAKGFSRDMAFYFGKVMECASFCAEPYMGKESILGTITDNDVVIEACHPGQRCTPASIAGHAMYERKNPFFEEVAGGTIDMRGCKYEQISDKATRVTGQKFVKSQEYYVKIEGAGKVGERYYTILGIRDKMTIKNIDMAIQWAKEKVKEQFGENGKDYHLFYHIYGKNAVLNDWEPVKEIKSHELGIAVEAVAKTREEAETISSLGARSIFYARLKTKGTAGGAALLTDEALMANPVYKWTMNHIVEIDDPYKYFPITIETINGENSI